MPTMCQLCKIIWFLSVKFPVAGTSSVPAVTCGTSRPPPAGKYAVLQRYMAVCSLVMCAQSTARTAVLCNTGVRTALRTNYEGENLIMRSPVCRSSNQLINSKILSKTCEIRQHAFPSQLQCGGAGVGCGSTRTRAVGRLDYQTIG